MENNKTFNFLLSNKLFIHNIYSLFVSFIYNKLIRDKIPDIIKQKYKHCKITNLDDEQFLKELINKLQEEIEELKTSLSKSEIIN